MKKKKLYKSICLASLIAFAVMHIIACFHAYKFTHFADSQLSRTQDPKALPFMKKLMAILTGVKNPRPMNERLPAQPYESIELQSNKKIALLVYSQAKCERHGHLISWLLRREVYAAGQV